MRFKLTVQVVAVVLAVAAAMLSHLLVKKHVTGSAGASWFDAGCSAGAEEGGADCETVLASRWSYLPPKPDVDPDTPEGQEALKAYRGIPAAFVGLVYFSVLAIWLVGVGPPSREMRLVHLLPLLVVGAGVLGSISFIYLMYSEIGAWCPWCLATHVLNFLIAICVLLLWPRRRQSERPAAPAGEEPAPSAVASAMRLAHPTGRTLLLTLIAIVLVVYGHTARLNVERARRVVATSQSNAKQCLSALARVAGDANKMVTNWRLKEKHTFTFRPDDPSRGGDPGGRSVAVVIFSDFGCPACRRFARFIEAKAQPLFDGRLRTILKHYPLSTGCNPQVTIDRHPHSCRSVKLIEGARMLGGNEAFWKGHDYLFANQRRQRNLTVETFAEAVGVDAVELREKMASAQIAQRLEQDLEQAKACGVNSTPAVFISGKRVDMIALMQIGFWDEMANRYWRRIHQPRPEHTKLKKGKITPGIPDPKAAP